MTTPKKNPLTANFFVGKIGNKTTYKKLANKPNKKAANKYPYENNDSRQISQR